MERLQQPEQTAWLRAENVGGIDEAVVEFRPGTNVLVGPNATNRTSLLQAVMAGLGSQEASLKADAEAGSVDLEIGDESYTRTLQRRDGTVSFGGDPFTDDPELADLFAFLLESNEARRAVATEGDLREILMRPVDTAEIRSRRNRLRERKREIESVLNGRTALEDELASVELERDRLEEQIEETRTELAEKQAEIEDADENVEASRDHTARIEDDLEALQETRSDLESVRNRLETERSTLEQLREERTSVGDELGELTEPSTERVRDLEDRIDRLHDRKRSIDSRINQLRAAIQFNEEFLDGDRLEVLDETDDDDDGDPSEQLLPAETALTCWTCGGETTRGAIEETLDRLRDARTCLLDRRTEIVESIDDATEEKRGLEERRERRERLEAHREQLQDDVADAESEIGTLEKRRDALEAEVRSLDDDVEELREEAYSDVVDRHREVTELELAVEDLRERRTTAESEISSIRTELDEMDSLAAELEDVEERLQATRTRIRDLEEDAVATFNEHMATVLERLGYDRIERIWIERVEREGRSRGETDDAVFDLHVVRASDDGAVYEDTIAHLSESEREVTGLVFALAGYLAHEVYDEIPFVLVDSIEAIDSERIPDLLEYVSRYAGYLVVALLPEDAAGVDPDHRITDV